MLCTKEKLEIYTENATCYSENYEATAISHKTRSFINSLYLMMVFLKFLYCSALHRESRSGHQISRSALFQ